MALVLIDGFDYLASADMAKRDWAQNGSSISTSGGRRGTRGLVVAQVGTSYARKRLPGNHSTLIVGVAFTASANTSAQVWSILMLSDGDSTTTGVQMGVRQNMATNCLEVWRGTTLLAADTLALNRNQYYHIEFKVVFHGSAGSYELKVAGVTRLADSGINTITTANAYANVLWLGTTSTYRTGSGGNQISYVYDDLYVCDGSGGVNDDFLGDCRVDLVLPTSEGHYSDFTPSTGTDNSATVDEATASGADYNSANVPDAKDTYNMQDLTPLLDPAVFGVQPVFLANVNNDGSRAMSSLVRSGGVDEESAVQNLLGSTSRYFSDILDLNPNGDVPWTQTTVNAAEFGVAVSI